MFMFGYEVEPSGVAAVLLAVTILVAMSYVGWRRETNR